MKLILILGLLFSMIACTSVKYDPQCEAYWSGNPNHKPGE